MTISFVFLYPYTVSEGALVMFQFMKQTVNDFAEWWTDIWRYLYTYIHTLKDWSIRRALRELLILQIALAANKVYEDRRGTYLLKQG